MCTWVSTAVVYLFTCFLLFVLFTCLSIYLFVYLFRGCGGSGLFFGRCGAGDRFTRGILGGRHKRLMAQRKAKRWPTELTMPAFSNLRLNVTPLVTEWNKPHSQHVAQIDVYNTYTRHIRHTGYVPVGFNLTTTNKFINFRFISMPWMINYIIAAH